MKKGKRLAQVPAASEVQQLYSRNVQLLFIFFKMNKNQKYSQPTRIGVILKEYLTYSSAEIAVGYRNYMSIRNIIDRDNGN